MQDARGRVLLWDVMRCEVVADWDPMDFREKERALWTPCAVNSWFSLDCRLGSIALHFEHPSCFGVGAPPAPRQALPWRVHDGCAVLHVARAGTLAGAGRAPRAAMLQQGAPGHPVYSSRCWAGALQREAAGACHLLLATGAAGCTARWSAGQRWPCGHEALYVQSLGWQLRLQGRSHTRMCGARVSRRACAGYPGVSQAVCAGTPHAMQLSCTGRPPMDALAHTHCVSKGLHAEACLQGCPGCKSL